HDDDRQIRPHPLDARNEVEGVFVRHDDVGYDGVTLALGDPSPERCCIARCAWNVAGAGERLIKYRPDGAVVVGDQDCATCPWSNPMQRHWSSRALCPGSTLPQAPKQAGRWIPVMSTGMTMVV